MLRSSASTLEAAADTFRIRQIERANKNLFLKEKQRCFNKIGFFCVFVTVKLN